jgi:hypothetical protein
VFGKQNVSGIPAIHYSLGNIDAGDGDVCASAHINDASDCAAMHAHAQLQLGVLLRPATNFERAFPTGK